MRAAATGPAVTRVAVVTGSETRATATDPAETRAAATGPAETPARSGGDGFDDQIRSLELPLSRAAAALRGEAAIVLARTWLLTLDRTLPARPPSSPPLLLSENGSLGLSVTFVRDINFGVYCFVEHRGRFLGFRPHLMRFEMHLKATAEKGRERQRAQRMRI